MGEAGGEVGVRGRRRRSRDELRAVNEEALVVAEDGHLAERSLERGLDLSLVVCTHEARQYPDRALIQSMVTH